MRTVFFVHIPKTGGTSFRLGVEELFEKHSVVYDYGIKSAETSELCLEYLYGNDRDHWAFFRACAEEQISFVSGHVGIGKFVAGFGAGNTITFVREPLQRVASEYKHFVRHYGFEGSFQDFYSKPEMQNRQKKLLGGLPVESIGVVGLNERYADSLELVNARFNWQIPIRMDNCAKEHPEDAHQISDSDRSQLEKLNADDVALYKEVKRLFETRWSLHQAGTPFAHARIQEATGSRISGCAWSETRDEEPLEIELLVNGEAVEITLAREPRPGLCRLRPPRGGYIGFNFAKKSRPGDLVQCRVSTTGQRFPEEPIEVSESRR